MEGKGREVKKEGGRGRRGTEVTDARLTHRLA